MREWGRGSIFIKCAGKGNGFGSEHITPGRPQDAHVEMSICGLGGSLEERQSKSSKSKELGMDPVGRVSEREEVKQSECDALKGTCRGREEESDPMTEARGGQAGGR